MSLFEQFRVSLVEYHVVKAGAFPSSTMSVFLACFDTVHLQPGKYLSVDLRRLSHKAWGSMSACPYWEKRRRLARASVVKARRACVRGLPALHTDRMLALMRAVAGDERPALLAYQRQSNLRKRDSTDDEVGF